MSLHTRNVLYEYPNPQVDRDRVWKTTHQWPQKSFINLGQCFLNLVTRILIPQPCLSVSGATAAVMNKSHSLLSTFLSNIQYKKLLLLYSVLLL